MSTLYQLYSVFAIPSDDQGDEFDYEAYERGEFDGALGWDIDAVSQCDCMLIVEPNEFVPFLIAEGYLTDMAINYCRVDQIGENTYNIIEKDTLRPLMQLRAV